MNQVQPNEPLFNVFCGSRDTMEKIAIDGAKALNPKTMKWQVIDANAKYAVVRSGEILHDLVSNLDLRTIAKAKGLIL